LGFIRLLDNPLVSRAFDALEGRIHAWRSCYDGSEEIGHYDNLHALMFWIAIMSSMIMSSSPVPLVNLDCTWRHDDSILFLVCMNAINSNLPCPGDDEICEYTLLLLTLLEN
jgi:hypothetical protein